MKKNLLILMAFSISIMGYGQSFSATDSYGNLLQYNVTSATTVSVMTGSTINNVNVNVPASVSNGGTTYNVTAISAFALGSKGISSITLPNSITSIGQQALQANNLTGIVLPGNLTTIGDYAFQNNQLTGLTLPENVTSIGNGAFRTNPILTVTSLATTPPTIITVNGPNDTFHQTGATYQSGDRSDVDLFIPAGTTTAYVTAAGALWAGFNSVTENLNVGDTYVDNYITYEVTSVANSTVKTINYNTAGGTNVTIPATIPNGLITYTVTEIGDNTFQNKGLTGVSLPNTLVTIGKNAFFINNISSVTIPDSVVTIDDIAFAQNQNMTNLVLGNSVASIGDAAFRFTALTTITIPASVTNIGVVAFGGLGDIITDVFCEGLVPPTISTSGAPNSDTFNLSRATIHLHIPAGTMGAYVTDMGALWTGFNPVSEDALLSASDFELTNNVKVITAPDAIKISHPDNIKLKNYAIYNISGAKISTGAENEVNTSTFSSGIYILKLHFDKGTATKKVAIN